MWVVEQAPVSTPQILSAVYFFVLPTDVTVIWSNSIKASYGSSHYFGQLESFYQMHVLGTPLIPIDPHLAMTLGWIDAEILARNMPYIDDKIRAAIALVT